MAEAEAENVNGPIAASLERARGGLGPLTPLSKSQCNLRRSPRLAAKQSAPSDEPDDLDLNASAVSEMLDLASRASESPSGSDFKSIPSSPGSARVVEPLASPGPGCPVEGDDLQRSLFPQHEPDWQWVCDAVERHDDCSSRAVAVLSHLRVTACESRPGDAVARRAADHLQSLIQAVSVQGKQASDEISRLQETNKAKGLEAEAYHDHVRELEARVKELSKTVEELQSTSVLPPATPPRRRSSRLSAGSERGADVRLSQGSSASTPQTPRTLRRRVDDLMISNEVLRDEQRANAEAAAESEEARINLESELADAREEVAQAVAREEEARAQSKQAMAALRARHDAQIAQLESQLRDLEQELEGARGEVPRETECEMQRLHEQAQLAQQREKDALTAAEVAKGKLEDQVKQHAALQEDMRLMYKRHKKDLDSLRSKFQAGEYEQRYHDLLEENKLVLQLVGDLEGMVRDADQVSASSQRVVQAHQAIQHQQRAFAELVRRNQELQDQLLDLEAQCTTLHQRVQDAERRRSIVDRARTPARPFTEQPAVQCGPNTPLPAQSSRRDLPATPSAQWKDASAVLSMQSPTPASARRSSVASARGRLSDFDLHKQLEAQRQHATRLREQMGLLMERHEETEMFASDEREVLEQRVEELEGHVQEAARLLEEKTQIITVYEDSLIEHRELLEEAESKLGAVEGEAAGKVSELTKAMEDLKKKRSGEGAKLKKAQAELRDATARLQDLASELDAERTSSQALQHKLEEVCAQLEDARKIADDANASVEEIRAQAKAMLSQNASVSEEEVQQLQTTVVDLQDACEQAESRIDALTQELNEQLEDKRDLEELVRAREEEVVKTEELMAELEQELNEREQMILELEKERGTLSRHLESVTAQLKESLDEEDKLRTQCDKLTDALGELQRKLEELANEAEADSDAAKQLAVAQNELEALRTEHAETLVKHDALAQECKDARAAKEKADTRCEALQRQVESLSQQLARANADLESEERRQVEVQLHEARQQAAVYSERVSEADARLESAYRELEAEQARSAQLGEELARVKLSVESLQDASAKTQAMEANTASLAAQLKLQEEQLAESNECNQRLVQQLQQKTGECQEMEQVARAAQGEAEAHEAHARRAETRAKAVECECAQLQSKVAMLLSLGDSEVDSAAFSKVVELEKQVAGLRVKLQGERENASAVCDQLRAAAAKLEERNTKYQEQLSLAVSYAEKSRAKCQEQKALLHQAHATLQANHAAVAATGSDALARLAALLASRFAAK